MTDTLIETPSNGFNEESLESKLAEGKAILLPNPLIDHLKADHLNRGVLIPLKTTQEVRQDHTVVQALITRAPTKSANDVVK